MLNAYLEYCLDSYCTVRETIDSLNSLTADLLHIKNKAAATIHAIFCVDIEKIGRLSIGLDDRSILTYISEDFEEAFTSLGDESAQGETMYYLGDYSLMSNRYVIPFDTALSAVDYWLCHGGLSDVLEWTDKIL